MQTLKVSFPLILALGICPAAGLAQIGVEKSVPRHLADGEEYQVSIESLITHGKNLFEAIWTGQEGGGRPRTKGTGDPISDPSAPLVFPRNFNRLSSPEANSCAGCHSRPRSGGGGDIVANAFLPVQRYDFVTFNSADPIATKGARDENGSLVTLQSIGNERLTIGMFGSGFIEMLSRQMTTELQAIRNSIPPGGSKLLVSKGISFGAIARDASGGWITSGTEGIPASSLVPDGSTAAPSLIIRPFHQVARVISLREFTNNAFNHHHGIQSTERFGKDTDPDGDGFTNEITRADITAVAAFQATLPVPGRVIPRDAAYEAAIKLGEAKFAAVGCTQCHVPTLPLTDKGWIYTEPNPFNAAGNLRPGEAPVLSIDLTSDKLPQPRLKPDKNGVIHVPAFTDLKLHDITDPGDNSNAEPLDMQHPSGSPAFFAGNRKFLTKKLWGAANESPFFHHGKYTTLREATLAHAGEALNSRVAFQALPAAEQDAVIEFLKSLRTLPEGTRFLVIDERGEPRPNLP